MPLSVLLLNTWVRVPEATSGVVRGDDRVALASLVAVLAVFDRTLPPLLATPVPVPIVAAALTGPVSLLLVTAALFLVLTSVAGLGLSVPPSLVVGCLVLTLEVDSSLALLLVVAGVLFGSCCLDREELRL